MQPHQQGPRLLIGGHEDKSPGGQILNRFVTLAGGALAKIVVMTCASKNPEKAGRDYRQAFLELGAGGVAVIDTRGKETAELQESLEALSAATGVFFVGGEPIRILDAIQGSAVDRLLHERNQRGLVLAGTSAGALMMPETVILDGESEINPKKGMIRSQAGMNFIDDVLIDVHFAQRGRFGRMLAAVTECRQSVGIGIDEDTALLFDRDAFEVLGTGAAFVFDADTPTFEELPNEGAPDLALCGIQLHVLPAGFEYSLKERRPRGKVDRAASTLPATRPERVGTAAAIATPGGLAGLHGHGQGGDVVTNC